MEETNEKIEFKTMVSNLKQLYNQYRNMQHQLSSLNLNFSEFKRDKEAEINILNNQKETDSKLRTTKQK